MRRILFNTLMPNKKISSASNDRYWIPVTDRDRIDTEISQNDLMPSGSNVE
jgi:hypothetical protein